MQLALHSPRPKIPRLKILKPLHAPCPMCIDGVNIIFSNQRGIPGLQETYNRASVWSQFMFFFLFFFTFKYKSTSTSVVSETLFDCEAPEMFVD